ncbi:MAG TPA: trypsin-like peptidase domain-containing protein [Syntrophomonadaceae bacterium]|nr:trypsin-like peptidase domain-containing protein [Syntrophomonadaceae bacterium]
MEKRGVKGAIYFAVFFLVGLGLVSLLTNMTGLEKPLASDNRTETTGSISEVARKVSPSVVGITSIGQSEDIFGQRSTESTGSGVVYDRKGYIITNNHVVAGTRRLLVTLVDGTETEAGIIGTDPRTDLAVIKINHAAKLTPARFGNSDRLLVGEQVVAIGNPLGLRFARSVTAGVVSGLNRLVTSEEGFVFRLIQTDAAINPGNSGGALSNLKSEVIGINNIKISSPGFEGIGFSIPSNQVKKVVQSIIKNGRVLRPLLGIKILGEISSEQAERYNLPLDYGVVIEPVTGGPAYQAGLQKYDIITRFNQTKIENSADLQDKIQTSKIGQSVQVRFMRIPVTAGEQTKVLSLQVKLAGD